MAMLADEKKSFRYSRSEIFLFYYIAAYIAIGYVYTHLLGLENNYNLLIYPATFLSVALNISILIICARMIYIMCAIRPDRLFQYLANDLRNTIFSVSRLKQSLPFFFAFLFFISAFTSLKSMILVVQAELWDQSFMELDRWLHFGRHPWEWLAPLLESPLAMFVLNLVYNVWFFIMLTFLLWQIFSIGNNALRMRFLWVYVLSWSIGGTLLATLFASVGPCFYGEFIEGVNPYTGLLTHLHRASDSYEIWAIGTQDMLLEAFRTAEVGVGVGISAMPSMHVATAVLFVFTGFAVNRYLGLLMLLHAVFIYLGSIQLAWHYAVDGIMGGLLVIVLWWAVGRMLARDNTLVDAGATG